MYNSEDLCKAKSSYDLRLKFNNYKKIGDGVYRVNPCPRCGGKDHFTLYAPNSRKNNTDYWTYSSFSNCCKGGTIVDYLLEFEGLTKHQAINKILNSSPRLSLNTLIARLHKDVAYTSYFRNRGFTIDTISRFKLGYARDGFNKAFSQYGFVFNNSLEKAYKYIIPILDSKGNVVNVIARQDGTVSVAKTRNLAGLNVRLLNEYYLTSPSNNSYIYIVEGWACALSLEQLGYHAVALNSVQQTNQLLEIIKNTQQQQGCNCYDNTTFIILFDNDKTGNIRKVDIERDMKKLNLSAYCTNIPAPYKDINDFLIADESGLKSFIDTIEATYKRRDQKVNFDSLLSTITNNYLEGGVNGISTGFVGLDKILGGGLYPDLYILGAGSSLGKTTFVQQIADHISTQGIPILFFSLEMSESELISKSIVRELYKIDNYINCSARDLLYGKLSADEYKLLYKHSNTIRDKLSNVHILEGSSSMTIDRIKQIITTFVESHSVKPVVIIDYLQIITPRGDKQSVDYNVHVLKQIVKSLELPIIVISSINRSNYLNYIDFTSFKESGSVEFEADVVLGLQLNIIHKIVRMKESELNIKRELYNIAKSKPIREVELVVLKNRFGDLGNPLSYKYVPKFNLFLEELITQKFNQNILEG